MSSQNQPAGGSLAVVPITLAGGRALGFVTGKVAMSAQALQGQNIPENE